MAKARSGGRDTPLPLQDGQEQVCQAPEALTSTLHHPQVIRRSPDWALATLKPSSSASKSQVRSTSSLLGPWPEALRSPLGLGRESSMQGWVGDVMGWGGGEDGNSGEGRAHCREVDMVTLSREAKELEPSRSDPPLNGFVPAPPLPLAQGSRSRVIRRNSAGQWWGVVGVWCANPGPRGLQRDRELPRRGRQSLCFGVTSSCQPAPPPPTRRRAGGPGSSGVAEAAEKRLSLSFLPFGTSISPNRRFSCSDISHGR